MSDDDDAVSDGPAEVVTPAGLRDWALPAATGSKYGRGQVVVVGGALRSPGAAMISGLAALRVGAGRLTLAVGASVASTVAVAVPESGVVPLPETADGHVRGDGIRDAADDIASADAVLVGPGLDDPDEAERMVALLPTIVGDDAVVVLDAFALGVLPACREAAARLAGRLVLTPNSSEAARLLDREAGDDSVADAREIARGYAAVVSMSGVVAAPDGRAWTIGAGGSGLGTSGSGDVLGGAITGLCARGADPAQAAVWATHAHAAAGDRLAVQVGPLGYLASELLLELPRVLVELEA
ncbi:NAD(P)H-hydrate dehydratase [Clavibacter capsici]|uniref:NAD(P)H-hydrate dehydratase n=1 Tax=Clavibacter capsici TaxID=1874630 RepID=UPI00293EFD3F|nr:NAD(P)H-hydrate dehydratase [Clavibacter capsici]